MGGYDITGQTAVQKDNTALHSMSQQTKNLYKATEHEVLYKSHNFILLITKHLHHTHFNTIYIYLAYSFCVNHFHRIFYYNALNTYTIFYVNNFQGYLILNLNTSWHFCRCNDYAVMNNVHMMN